MDDKSKPYEGSMEGIARMLVGRSALGAMNREMAIAALKECQANRDTEAAHFTADNVLCSLLWALGYADVADEYDKVKKWYA